MMKQQPHWTLDRVTLDMPLSPLGFGFLLGSQNDDSFCFLECCRDSVTHGAPYNRAGLETEEQELLPGDF